MKDKINKILWDNVVIDGASRPVSPNLLNDLVDLFEKEIKEAYKKGYAEGAISAMTSAPEMGTGELLIKSIKKEERERISELADKICFYSIPNEEFCVGLDELIKKINEENN